MTKNFKHANSVRISKSEQKLRKAWGGPVPSGKVRNNFNVTAAYAEDVDWNDPAIQQLLDMTAAPKEKTLSELTPQVMARLDEWSNQWQTTWGDGYGMNPAQVTRSTVDQVRALEVQLRDARSQMTLTVQSMTEHFNAKFAEIEKAFDLKMEAAREELRKEREKSAKLADDNAGLVSAIGALGGAGTLPPGSVASYYMTTKGLASAFGGAATPSSTGA